MSSIGIDKTLFLKLARVSSVRHRGKQFSISTIKETTAFENASEKQLKESDGGPAGI
jgi:hypothetical protein